MSRPFYESAGGLRFSCTRCGNCCTRPGPVYFPASDLKRAAGYLKITEDDFRRRYRLVPQEDGVEALDPPGDEACVFYDDARGCTIYEGRPTQCRTWPFWAETVQRRRSWDKATRDCPGMNQGRHHTPREISRALVAWETLELPEGDPW